MAGPYTTNKGKNVITDRLQTTPATYSANGPRFIGFGAGTGVAQSGNALAAPIGGKAGAAVGTGTGATQESLVTTSVTNDTYQVVGTLTASGTWGITESGLFTALGSGTGDLFAYSDFGLVTLNASDSIQFTWKVQFT